MSDVQFSLWVSVAMNFRDQIYLRLVLVKVMLVGSASQDQELWKGPVYNLVPIHRPAAYCTLEFGSGSVDVDQ